MQNHPQREIVLTMHRFDYLKIIYIILYEAQYFYFIVDIQRGTLLICLILYNSRSLKFFWKFWKILPGTWFGKNWIFIKYSIWYHWECVEVVMVRDNYHLSMLFSTVSKTYDTFDIFFGGWVSGKTSDVFCGPMSRMSPLIYYFNISKLVFIPSYISILDKLTKK